MMHIHSLHIKRWCTVVDQLQGRLAERLEKASLIERIAIERLCNLSMSNEKIWIFSKKEVEVVRTLVNLKRLVKVSELTFVCTQLGLEVNCFSLPLDLRFSNSSRFEGFSPIWCSWLISCEDLFDHLLNEQPADEHTVTIFKAEFRTKIFEALIENGYVSDKAVKAFDSRLSDGHVKNTTDNWQRRYKPEERHQPQCLEYLTQFLKKVAATPQSLTVLLQIVPFKGMREQQAFIWNFKDYLHHKTSLNFPPPRYLIFAKDQVKSPLKDIFCPNIEMIIESHGAQVGYQLKTFNVFLNNVACAFFIEDGVILRVTYGQLPQEVVCTLEEFQNKLSCIQNEEEESSLEEREFLKKFLEGLDGCIYEQVIELKNS